MKIAAADKKLVIGGGIVFLLLLAAAAFITPEEDLEEATPSTFSVKSGGAKATFALLEELGYHTERWTKSSEGLAEVQGKTLLILAQPTFEGIKSKSSAAVRKYLEAGGTVLAAGSTGSYLLPESGSYPIWTGQYRRSWDNFRAMSPSAITRAAPEIVMPSRGRWTILPAGAVPLYGDDKQVMAIEYPYGKGRVIWVASSAPLSNAGIKVESNVKFLAAVLAYAQPEIIFWYAPEKINTPTDWTSPAAAALIVQFSLMFIFALWTFARHSGPVRALATRSRLSPLEFVEALAGLYRRRRAGQVSIEQAYKRFRSIALAKAGVPRTAGIDTVARSVALRSGIEEPEIYAVLQECESSAYDPDLPSVKALALCVELQKFEESITLKPKERQS